MPGPVALKRKQYYGFPGNHFWPIVADVLGEKRTADYAARRRMVLDNGLALWDVFASCAREGAADAAILEERLNDVPGLVRRYPGLRAVFLNGGAAAAAFEKNFAARVRLPRFRMPSTSPAHASMDLAAKRRRWRALLKFL
jgi:double-stranded uracil-DNA glycosylase